MQKALVAAAVVALIWLGAWLLRPGLLTDPQGTAARDREVAMAKMQSQALQQIERERRIQESLQTQILSAMHTQFLLGGALLITGGGLAVCVYVLARRRREMNG